MTETVGKAVSMQQLGPIIAETVRRGSTAELTVTGRSMRPLLLDRVSRVKLSALGEAKYGDVVLYRRDNGTYVLHRIVQCCEDGTYTMCGDGQTVPERGLRREQLLAVVESFARRERWRSVDHPLYALWWRLHLTDRPLRIFYSRGIGYLRRHLL